MLALCISAVAVAALVFVANDPDKAPTDQHRHTGREQALGHSDADGDREARTDQASEAETEAGQAGRGLRRRLQQHRVPGLAGGVAEKAKSAGWNVVGSDNWYGTVDGTSVYFPPRLKAAAKELGNDLGIKRLRPAEEPMQFDRLTVILTDDYL